MHPAPSIIVFSTLSGAGFGLIAFLSLLPRPEAPWAVFASAALALALCTAGLISSTFHLGRPERAWRALTQWRSSWLSREGVLSIATLSVFAAHIAGWLFFGWRLPLLGVVTAGLAVLSVYATGMIYASLRSVPVWHDPLTPFVYLAFAASSGAMLAAMLSGHTGQGREALGALALLCLAVAWVTKMVWWRRSAEKRFGGSTIETATGLGALGRVRLLEAPHTSPNYLMKEMVFQVGRKRAAALRTIGLVVGGALPALFLLGFIAAPRAWPLAFMAALTHLVGLLAERWLFFAEAEHTVALYYHPARRNVAR